MKSKEYKYKINGNNFNVKVGDMTDGHVTVEVNGVPYHVELENTAVKTKTLLNPVKKPSPAPRTETGEKVIAKAVIPSTGGFTVTAPLPGTLMSLNVKVGDTVNAGDTVCVLEAMKMENDIHTSHGGTVKQIVASIGDAVPQDGPIMILE